MGRKRKSSEGSSNKVLPGWLASYADMFTVLMAFFVLLFASSTLDEAAFMEFLISFNPARVDNIARDGGGGNVFMDDGHGLLPQPPPPPPEGPGGDDLDGGLGGVDERGDVVGDMMSTFRTYMAVTTLGENGEGADVLPPGVTAEEGEGYIRITLRSEDDDERVLFASAQANLQPAAMDTLNMLGPVLSTYAEQGHIIIVEGHTDSRPMLPGAMFATNWSLSNARAATVVEYLTGNWGISAHSIFATGRGEYFPVADNATPEGQALNRRVEIIVFAVEQAGDGTVTPGAGLGRGWWTIPLD